MIMMMMMLMLMKYQTLTKQLRGLMELTFGKIFFVTGATVDGLGVTELVKQVTTV